MNKAIKFAGLTFNGLEAEQLLQDNGRTTFIVPVNAQLIRLYNTSQAFRGSLENATLTFDGQIPYLLAKLRNPGQRIEKISGSALIYRFLQKAANGCLKVYILGGDTSANEGALVNIRQKYGVDARGCSPPYFKSQMPTEVNTRILGEIREFQPDYVLVGFGAPKQETWVAENYNALNAAGVKAVQAGGGSIDFLAQRFKRAPAAVQNLGLEGLYRLIQQPNWARLKRLFESLTIFRYCWK